MSRMLLGTNDAELMDGLIATLESLGHEVAHGSTTHEFLSLAEESMPRLAVLDDVMGPQPVDETLALLQRDEDIPIPVLMMSDSTEADNPELSVFGVCEVLPRGSDFKVLTETLTRLLDDDAVA